MKIFKSIFCLTLVSTLLLLAAGCGLTNPTNLSSDLPETSSSSAKLEAIHWLMHGAWITQTGEVLDSVDFSLRGELPQDYQTHHAVQSELEINWPENFEITSAGETIYYGFADVIDSSRHLWYSGYSMNQHMQTSVQQSFHIFPESQLVVFQWGHKENQYLIASTDPNANLAKLFMDFESYFIDKH